jgi:hypothetical protein
MFSESGLQDASGPSSSGAQDPRCQEQPQLGNAAGGDVEVFVPLVLIVLRPEELIERVCIKGWSQPCLFFVTMSTHLN